MKKVLLMFLGAFLTLTACEKESDNGKFNYEHPIYINGVDKANKNVVYTEKLSAGEVLRLDSIWLMSHNMMSSLSILFAIDEKNMSVSNGRIDTLSNRLEIRANYINNGVLSNPLFDSDNFYLIRDVYDSENNYLGYDTLAYIPNAQRQKAKEMIDSLYASEQWEKIYDIFDNAFTFIPCTGEELFELERSGEW